MAYNVTGTGAIKHISRMKTDRNQYDSLFDEVKLWYTPSSGDFASRGSDSIGDVNNSHIYNQTGTQSGERLAQILYSTLAPVHEQFFTLVPPAESDHPQSTRDWLKKSTSQLSSKLAASNLPMAMVQILRSLVFFGTGAIYPTIKDGKLKYQAYYPEDIWIDEDFDGDVNSMATFRKCTAEQLIEKYGNQVSQEVRDRSSKPTRANIVVYNYFKLCDDRVWRLFIVEEKTKHIITDYSFTSKPIVVSRWQRTSYEKYGRSPGVRGLPSNKTLQRIEATVLRQSEKAVDPPIAIPYDASANALELAFDTNAGGVIEVQADATGAIVLPQAIMLAGSIEVGQYQIDKLEAAIKEIFFLDVLTVMMGTSTTATATQIDSMNAEKLDLVVPIVIQLISDLVKPLIERSFQLLMDEGVIKTPKDSKGSEDGPYNVGYDIEVYSSLIMKLRQLKLNTSLQTVQTVGQLAAIDPGAIDQIDIGKLVTHILTQSNLPTDAIRTGTELGDYRKLKADAAEKAKQAEMLAAGVKPVDTQQAPEEGSLMAGMAEMVGQ